MAKNETYEDFVDKFHPKKTTDDCYTPPAVYDAVRSWATMEYGLEGREVVRPFSPGGDFERYNYPTDCVVIDNPPFSILARILDFYRDHGIDYFLFSPSLTSGTYYSRSNIIITDSSVVYDNGAQVNTAFLTNMGAWAIRTAPDLRAAIAEAQPQDYLGKPQYGYPQQVTSCARLQKIATVDFRARRNECAFVRALDAQRLKNKVIYGGGLLLAEKKAAELKAAELKAAELKTGRETITWQLSAREKAIIATLGQNMGPDGQGRQERMG